MADTPYMPVTRGADKSGACAAQEQLSAPLEMSAREFTRYIFQWLNQVVSDPDLPASAFKVGYIIAQHMNRKKPDAFPGTRSIATASALSQPNVIKLVPKLVANGHLDLRPGRAGSGHSHRYRLILKDHPADHFGSFGMITPLIIRKTKKITNSPEMITPVVGNDHPADQNYLSNHRREPSPLRKAQRQSKEESQQGPANAAATRHSISLEKKQEPTAIDQTAPDGAVPDNLFGTIDKPEPKSAAEKLRVPPPSDPEVELFRRGKEVLGPAAGGMIAKLLKAKRRPELARAAIEMASVKENPREYIGAIIRGSADEQPYSPIS